MRRAGDRYRELMSNPIARDAQSTLLQGALIGGGSLLAGADLDDVVLAGLLAGGATMAARPLLARGGRALGRKVDAAMADDPPLTPQQQIQNDRVRGTIVGPGSIGGLRLLNAMIRDSENPRTKKMLQGIKDNVALPQYMANIHRPDGTKRGPAEMELGMLLRNRADDPIQLLLGLTAFTGKDEEQQEI